MMAGQQSNYVTIAYVDDGELDNVLQAFVAQALTQNIRTVVAGTAVKALS
jgi:mannose/fructose-specific phosphotransferase system component IIA